LKMEYVAYFWNKKDYFAYSKYVHW